MSDQWMCTALDAFIEARADRGWHQGIADGGKLEHWNFGIDMSKLVADVDHDSRKFHLFVYDEDLDLCFDTIAELEAVLDGYERKYRGIGDLHKEVLADDEISLPEEFLRRIQAQLEAQDRALDD